MPDVCLIELSISKEQLENLVQQALRNLNLKYLVGNLWVGKDSPDAPMIILVKLLEKALKG